MTNRYTLETFRLSKLDLEFPGRMVWAIYDNKLKQYSLSYYLTEEAGREMLERKSSK